MQSISELANRVGSRLLKQDRKLATAESCTGGLVAAALTEIAGSSQWFERGTIVYSNEAKTELLGVPPSVLQKYGAVSVECAAAMAEGMRRHSNAQVALSITGVAGPSGGTVDKPVGTVCFAWSMRGVPTRAEMCTFPGDRQEVRRRSVLHALIGVLLILESETTAA